MRRQTPSCVSTKACSQSLPTSAPAWAPKFAFRYLKANFGAHAGADVGKLCEQALVETHDGVCLRIAAQVNLLQSEGQQREGIDRAQPEGLVKFGPGDEAIVTKDQAAVGG